MNGTERGGNQPAATKQMWVVWHRPGVRMGYATASPQDIAQGMCTFLPLGGGMVRTSIWNTLTQAQRETATAQAREQRLETMHTVLGTASWSRSTFDALPLQTDITHCSGCGSYSLAVGRELAVEARGCNNCGRVFRRRPAVAIYR